MNILVTGAAGFIGMHTCLRLLERGHRVTGLDSLNDYYDPALKTARLAQLAGYADFSFHRLDIADREAVAKLFAEGRFSHVVHLAAQAGVRYSLENPHAYVESNVAGFLNVLEGCRRQPVEHLVYASSSSVYGQNAQMPYDEGDNVDHPVSLYAATKKANESMAHAYSHLYGIPVTGLRFFTVYGPWGRPDMAPFLFTDAIMRGRPIKVFNHGNMRRDFTYIDDIVAGICQSLQRPPERNLAFDTHHPDPATSNAPWRILNIGNGQPVDLGEFIATLEHCIGRSAEKILLPLQSGDVLETYADTKRLQALTGALPKTDIRTGVARFVEWYREYYQR